MFPNDNIDRLSIQFVSLANFFCLATFALFFDFDVHQFVNEVLFAGADGVRNSIDFIVAQVGTLPSQQLTCSRRKEQHVTTTEQLVSSVIVKNNAAVRFTGNLERQSSWQVRFNQTGDNVDGWLLCCKD